MASWDVTLTELLGSGAYSEYPVGDSVNYL
jgi:hypothetical protein